MSGGGVLSPPPPAFPGVVLGARPSKSHLSLFRHQKTTLHELGPSAWPPHPWIRPGWGWGALGFADTESEGLRFLALHSCYNAEGGLRLRTRGARRGGGEGARRRDEVQGRDKDKQRNGGGRIEWFKVCPAAVCTAEAHPSPSRGQITVPRVTGNPRGRRRSDFVLIGRFPGRRFQPLQNVT